jgi:hypothetical protein
MRNVWIFIVVFAIALLFLSTSADAEQGDCDGDGVGGTVADFVYLTEHLFMDGPAPPIPRTCDCDNFPGVNYGDIWQLQKHIQNPLSTPLYDSPGYDYPAVEPSMKFLVLGKPDGESTTEAALLGKRFTDHTPPYDLSGLLLTISFAAGPGEADLNCTGIDFSGSAAINLTGNYDNGSKTLWIWNSQQGCMYVWPDWRIIATVQFVLDPSGSPGSGVELRPGVSGARRPIMLGVPSFRPGIAPGFRVNYPVFVPLEAEQVGDVSCDGIVDIDDVVYIINWIFIGGPPPGDPDGDGVPDC